MVYDYLAELNPEQRRAVQYGVKPGSANHAGPLLVIAGAGTGKTKTLTHRVAHLIVNGINPHRILLLTFSRRAAVEMTRRVERITAAALGTGQADLPWSGTFHAIGADLAPPGAKLAHARLKGIHSLPKMRYHDSLSRRAQLV
jgi:DNA helicase-2/ATP-dependent DNA helicase PcrA